MDWPLFDEIAAHLQDKIMQWNEGEMDQWHGKKKPELTKNEAIVVWFCTGYKPKNLIDAPPFMRLMHLTPEERKFIDDYILITQKMLLSFKPGSDRVGH